MAALDLNAKYTAPGASDNDSRKWMVYNADDGTLYAVYMSEAIGETFGFLDVSPADTGLPQLPSRFQMRRLFATSTDGKVKQSFAVGNTNEDVWTEGGTVTVARKGKAVGVTLTFTGSRGESRTFVKAADSGQESGDVD